MNAVIYARYSSDNQREESIEGQLRECQEYANKQGITIIGTYIDRALSAKTDNRPEFQRMIRDSAKGLFEVIIIWKLDRFARNRYDSAHYKNVLRKNGVRVLSAKENISDGPEGIILESMLEGMAEYYSAELSVKVKRGMTENALKCKHNGGRPPIGYILDDNRQYQIDPVTEPIAKEIFERYADGESVAGIIKNLNVRGFVAQDGGKLTYNTFRNILRNRKYIGEYHYGETTIPNGVPAIIPVELFERVQKRVEKNRRAPARTKAKEDYLLTTKLYCGKCGTFMVGESGKSKTGKMHYYYKCLSAKRKRGCNKKAVKKDWIEDLVVSFTMEHVLSDHIISRIAEAVVALQERENAVLPALRQQLTDTEQRISNVLNAIEQGVLTPTTKQRLTELEERRDGLKISIIQEEMARPMLTHEQVVFWISRFKEGNITDSKFRQRLIDCFVNSIYLYDDRIVLVYNYKDGTQTVTLDEIEALFDGNGDNESSDLAQCGPPLSQGTLCRDCPEFCVNLR